MSEVAAAAGRLRGALDPLAFAERAGVELYPYQVEVIQSPQRQKLLNWSRQAGKSSVTSVMAGYKARYSRESLTLILSPSERQSKLLLGKTKSALKRADPGILVNDNSLDALLTNGSQIWALPGSESTVRGFSSVDLIVVDEASRASDALYHAVRPMLAASNGEVVLLSTPFGKRGFFYQEWIAGSENWLRTSVSADRVPHISPEFLEDERKSLPPELFQQEYFCQFVDTLDQIFTHELVSSLMSDEIAPLFGGTDSWSASLSDPNLQPLPSF